MKNKTITFNENEVSIKKYKQYALQFISKTGKISYWGHNKRGNNTHCADFKNAHLQDLKSVEHNACYIFIDGYNSCVETKWGELLYSKTVLIPKTTKIQIVRVDVKEIEFVKPKIINIKEQAIDVNKLVAIKELQK